MSKIQFFLKMLNKELYNEIKDEFDMLEVNITMLGFTTSQEIYDSFVRYNIDNGLFGFEMVFFESSASSITYVEKWHQRLERLEGKNWLESIEKANDYMLKVHLS